MSRALAVCALSLVTVSGAAADPIAVHVSGGPAKAATKEATAELKAKSDAARKSYADLHDALKKQFGKKEEAWPADKQSESQAAYDAFMEAQVDWFYSAGLQQKDIDDSVRELSEALAKKPVRVAASPAEADLVVQVVGRAKVTTDELANPNGPKNVAAELVLRVSPGQRMNVPTLARSAPVWNAKKSFWMHANTDTVHAFSADAPYWLLISRKPGTAWIASYKGAAGLAADAIEKFGADNADKVAAARN
jgi:hypothetical protein